MTLSKNRLAKYSKYNTEKVETMSSEELDVVFEQFKLDLKAEQLELNAKIAADLRRLKLNRIMWMSFNIASIVILVAWLIYMVTR